MKRTFTFVLVLLGATLVSVAQSFEFRYRGASLADGAVVNIYAEPDSFFPDQMGCMTNPPSAPENGLVVKTLDDSTLSGNAKLEIISNTLEPQIIQWCMGGECLLMTNKTSQEKEFATNDQGVAKVEFDATGVADEGTLEATLTVTYGIETQTVNIRFIGALGSDGYYTRKVVMEEGTGTWCGWCVRGIETLKLMQKKYPDNFIGIGLHAGDEMENAENYAPVINTMEFFPGCHINRRTAETEDVSLENTEWAVIELMDKAIARIEAEATFTDETKSSVSVKTKTTFSNDLSAANFKIAYVVVEDQVGPYTQGNYYSGMELTPDNYMYDWTLQSSSLPVVFNDVARGIYPNVSGEDGSVPASVTKGVANEYEYTVTLPSTVADPNNISIVTLLINGDNGEIINADKVALTADNPTAIQTVKKEQEDRRPVCYNLNGQRVDKPGKGLYIKNGQKVILK